MINPNQNCYVKSEIPSWTSPHPLLSKSYYECESPQDPWLSHFCAIYSVKLKVVLAGIIKSLSNQDSNPCHTTPKSYQLACVDVNSVFRIGSSALRRVEWALATYYPIVRE